MDNRGVKDDAAKLRMDLIPADSLRDLADVYTMGAKKYADENWRKGIEWKRIYGAILRHLTLWFLGQDVDLESGLSHLAHAAWGCFTLLNYRRTHPELDNRPLDRTGRAFYPSLDASTGQAQSRAVPRVLPREDEVVLSAWENEKGPQHPGSLGEF